MLKIEWDLNCVSGDLGYRSKQTDPLSYGCESKTSFHSESAADPISTELYLLLSQGKCVIFLLETKMKVL